MESIAAPIFNAGGQVKDALFMTGPAGRFESHSKEEMIESIRDAAMRISIQMGYRPKEDADIER